MKQSSRETIESVKGKIFKTKTGIWLINKIFLKKKACQESRNMNKSIEVAEMRQQFNCPDSSVGRAED